MNKMTSRVCKKIYQQVKHILAENILAFVYRCGCARESSTRERDINYGRPAMKRFEKIFA